MVKQITVSLFIGSIVMFGVSGCTSSNDTKVANLQKDLAKQNAVLVAENKKLKDDADKKAILASKKSVTNAGNVAVGDPADFNKRYPLLPENAKSGQCFSRVLIPPTYKWTKRKMLKSEKSAQYKIIPATYKFVDQTQKVSEESFKLISVAATYKWEKDKVMVEPEKTKLVKVPAKYKMVTKKILIKEARDIWKQGTEPVEKIDNSTGEIVCKVHIPAVYKTITEKAVVVDAHTKKIVIPARYKYIKRRVTDVAAHTKKVPIVAKFQTVKVKKLVTPVKKVKIDIPEEHQYIKEKSIVTKAHMKWQQILCKTNTTVGLVSRLQQSLKSKNHYLGKIDGVYGSLTKNAVKKYQKSKGLPSGALTLETLKSLNII